MMENFNGKVDLKFLGIFFIRNLSVSSKESLQESFACSTSSRDSKIRKMNQYEENNGKPQWEMRLKVSRKILYKESKRILQGILVRTLCLFYKFKRFKDPKHESI